MLSRVARIEHLGSPRYVELIGGEGLLLSAAPWLGGRQTGERIASIDGEGRGAGRRLCPVEPTKILCVGRNYRAHAEELGHDVPEEPLLFFKPPSSLLDPDGAVELPSPAVSQRVEHEVELALVVGKRLSRASEAEATAAIAGCTIAFDVTARDLQRREKLWTRAKGFDTFCPVGPVVVSGLDASDLAIGCSVNGSLRQDGRTSLMVFSPAFVLSYISQTMRLEPGDLVLTGTPAGVGPLKRSDRLVGRVEDIGELTVTVA